MDILYFAWVREAIGRDAETVTPPADVGTIAELLAWLSKRSEAYAVLRDVERLRFAIDQRFEPIDASIVGAAEVAIFPPVTGG
jgi:molybdopterin synthase sulfur carrier subunit